MPVSDAHGMKAMRRCELEPIVGACVMTRSLFDVEVVLRAGRAGLESAEVPAVVIERRPPRSAITKRSVETIAGLVRLAFVMRNVPASPPAAGEPDHAAAPAKVAARRGAPQA
jgi:hypothetical protein